MGRESEKGIAEKDNVDYVPTSFKRAHRALPKTPLTEPHYFHGDQKEEVTREREDAPFGHLFVGLPRVPRAAGIHDSTGRTGGGALRVCFDTPESVGRSEAHARYRGG